MITGVETRYKEISHGEFLHVAIKFTRPNECSIVKVQIAIVNF